MNGNSKAKHELIDLLLYDGNGNFKVRFKELLQSITDLNSQPYQTGSNIHNPNNYKFNSPEFFAYFILGSVLVLPYTKIMEDLSIESIYVRPIKGFSKGIEAVDLCFIVNKDGKKVAKILTFTVNYSNRRVSTPVEMVVHSNSHNIDQYLMKILQDNGLDHEEIKIGEFEVLFSVGDRIDVQNKKRVISGFKSHRGHSNVQEFQRIEKIDNDIYDIDGEFASLEKMTLEEKQDLSVKMVDKIFSIFNLNVKTFKLSKSRTAYQAFAFGSMVMNFKTRGKLNCFINSILGKDYSDLIFTMDHRSIKGATPLVVKFGEGEGQDIIDQMKSKGYDIAPLQLKPMVGKRILVGVSFLENQPIKPEEVTISQQENFFSQNYNAGLNFEINKDTIESFIKDIYNSIVDFIPSDQNELAFDQKYKNYLSRLILGQLLASNLNKDIKKWIFVPDDKSLNTKVVRFALMTGVEKKRAIVFNIIEDSDQLSENILPPGIIEECLAINIQINPKNAKYGFKSGSQEEKYFQKLTIEEISISSSRDRWNIINESINLQALSKEEKDSQKRQKEVESSVILKLGKVINIADSFINNELDFQAVMQGVFTGISNIVPLTEVNYSPDGRPDLALHHTNSEVPLIVVEEKFFPGNDVIEGQGKLQEAIKQIEKSKQYKAFTDAHKVIRLAMQFNKYLEKKLSYQFVGEADVELSESDNSIMERLFQYIEEDRYNDLRKEKIEDYINSTRDGQTLLHIAVSKNRERIVDYLLEVKYVNVDARNKDDLTSLYIAVDKGFAKIAKKLSEKRADLNIEDNNGKTPLMVAVDHKNIDMAATLLDAGADANSINKNGTPILHYVIESKNYAMVKLFLSKGAYFDIRSEDLTPAVLASQIIPNSDIDKLLNNIDSVFRDIMSKKSVSNILERFKKEEVQIVLNVIDVHHNALLHYAAQNGHEDAVEELVKAGVDVNAKGEDGSTPLHLATEEGCTNIVVKLIEEKAQINVIDENKNTPLHQAVKNNHKIIVEMLLKQGAIVEAQDIYGYTSIVWAVKENLPDVVELLIKYGADVNTKYEGSKALLSLAGEYGLEDMAVLLIKNGAYIQPIWQAHYFSAADKARRLIFTAVWLFEIINFDNPYEDIVKKHDDLQQKMKYEDEKIRILFSAYDDKGKTLLHYAAEKCNKEVIKFLIDKGVDVNIKDKNGNTALHFVAKEGSVDTVKLLLKEGAHFDARNKEDNISLDLSSGETQKLLKEVSDLFDHAKGSSYKKAGAILKDLSKEDVKVVINARDNQDRTLLHHAAEKGNKQIVELFINNRACFDVLDNKNQTPLDLVPESSEVHTLLKNINDIFSYVKNSDYEKTLIILQNLVQQAINLTIIDSKRRTLLHYAAEKGNKQIVKLLLENGAYFSVLDNENKTPLDLTPESSETHTLLKNINDIFSCVKNGDDKNAERILDSLSEKDIELILASYDAENKSCFQHAIEKASYEATKLLIDKIDVNAAFNNGIIPLYTAAINNDQNIAILLMDKGADVNGKCKNGNTALHAAVENDYESMVELLLERKAKWYVKNNKNKTPLGFASESSKTYKLLKSINDLFDSAKNNNNQKAKDILSNLSQKQAEIVLNLSDEKGNTCFLYAVKNGHSDVAELFIARGANVDVKNNNGETASYLAVEGGYKDVLKLLIEHNIFNYQYDDGSTALHVAVEAGHLEVVRLLIEKRASINNFSINTQDKDGNTALHIAAAKGHTETVLMLIGNGAVINVVDHQNKTPLDLAPESSRARLLFESVKDISNAAKNNNVLFITTTLKKLEQRERFFVVNINDEEGKTPLDYAVAEDHIELVLTLISNGANVNDVNYQNKTPLDLAPEGSRTRLFLESIKNVSNAAKHNNVLLITETLKKLEPKERFFVVNVSDKEGKTPFHYAITEDHIELLLTLISNGANVNFSDYQNKTPLDLAPEGSRTRLLLESIKNVSDAVKNNNVLLITETLKKLEPRERSLVVNICDKEGKFPLHYAAAEDHVKLVLMLMGNGANVKFLDNQGKTPLDLAPEGSRTRLFLESVDSIFDAVKKDEASSIIITLKELEPDEEFSVLNAQDKEGKTPLHYAAELGYERLILMLISGGANVKFLDNQGKTPLDLAPEGSRARLLLESVNNIVDAAKKGDTLSIIRTLKELKKEEFVVLNARDNEGKTPLHYAAQSNDERSVVILINNGAGIDIMDYQNKTPLDLAPGGSKVYILLNNIIILFSTLRNKDDAGVKTVIKAFELNNNLGIAVKAKDSNGMTYLHYIIYNNDDIKMVELAIKNKANINAKDQYGNTPLYVAALKGNAGIAKLLLDNGADILSISDGGNTILHAAVRSGHEEIISLLMEKDPTLANAKNNDGLTPLELFKAQFTTRGMSREERERYQRIIDKLSSQTVSVGVSTACLSKKSKKGRGNKKNKREIRMRRDAGGSKCLLGENGEVDKEKTGLEVSEESFDKSFINNEKLKAYQEDLNNRLDKAIAQSDKNAQNLIREEKGQLNELILEIQQAQAISSFYMLSGEFESQEFNDKLLSVTENINGEAISPESLQYFKQVIKINLLRTILPLIKNEDFKNLLLNNPEKFGQDQGLLDNIFAGIKEAVSKKNNQQQLKYEDFEELESNINQEISSMRGEIDGVDSQDINKSALSNYVFKSFGLSITLLSMNQDSKISTDLQKRVHCETLINLGAFIHDHKSHIKAYHDGHEHNTRIDSLKNRISNSKLLSIAHDIYYLHKNKGNVDQRELYSDQVKNIINSYGNIDSEYKLNDIHNQFNIDEVKSYFSKDELKKFGDEFKTYNEEVVTIHSTQVFTSYAAIEIGIKDNIGNDKNIIIDNVGDIKTPSSFMLDEANLGIQLRLESKEYVVTGEQEGENTKFYLNVDGYKIKISDLISSFSEEEKNNIHNELHKL